MKLAGSISSMLAFVALTLVYSAIVASGSFVWFDAPSEYNFLMYASGASMGACISKCSRTPSCVWTKFDDGRCELRAASQQSSADLFPTLVLVRSNKGVDLHDFIFKNSTAAVFTTSAEWCTAETNMSQDVVKCKSMCESDSECGRVSYDVTNGSCEIQKPCGNVSSKVSGVVRLPKQNIQGQNTALSVADYADIPSGYMCGRSYMLEMLPGKVPSMNDCKKDCEDTNWCTAVDLATVRDKCRLYTTCKHVKRSNNLAAVSADGKNYVRIPKGYSCYGNGVASGLTGITSLKECQKKCNKCGCGCGAVTWNKSTQKCYLKEACKEWEPIDDGTIQHSATKVATVVSKKEYTEMPGHYRCKGVKVGQTIKGLVSQTECRAECDKDRTCGALTYRPSKNACLLFKSCESYIDKAGEETLAVIKNGEYADLPPSYACGSATIAGCQDDSHCLERVVDQGFTSMDDCKNDCSNTNDCVAVTFIKYSQDSDNECFLYQRCDQYVEQSGTRSSRRI